MKQPYNVLLYYCYTPIESPEMFRDQHQRYCAERGLRGRIIVAKEGINGTISGLAEVCREYMHDLRADARFQHTHFKVAAHHQYAFRKLNVRVKSEIVNAGLPHIRPDQGTGPYVTAHQLQEMQKEKAGDVVLLDVRSNYEHRLGRFKGAVTLDINHFREFPDQIEKLAPYRDKKIVTYCTGGVKCEKASAYLLRQGFSSVHQLYGGIIQYGLDTDGGDFEGTCYVFDNRLTTPINRSNPTVVAQCHVCRDACERMVNCANPTCNQHVPICASCAETLEGACSKVCQQHPQKRSYDGTGYYNTQMNGYNPYNGLSNK